MTTGEDDSGVTTNELPVSFQMTPQPASDGSAPRRRRCPIGRM